MGVRRDAECRERLDRHVRAAAPYQTKIYRGF